MLKIYSTTAAQRSVTRRSGFGGSVLGGMRSSQMFVSVHASVTNYFNLERSLTSRSNFKLNRTAALAEWRQLLAGQELGLGHS